MSSATDAFKAASGIEAGSLGDVIVVSFFGILLLVIAYIAIQKFKQLEKGGDMKGFVRTVIRAVFIVIICSVFLI